MATQLKHTDCYTPVAPRPNIRVAFSAGLATIAARDVLATIPAAVREATLDELAVGEQTRALIADAQSLLSPAMFTAFLGWGEASTTLATLYQTDEEGAVHCAAVLDSIEALRAVPAVTIHDIVLKTYLLTLEATDSSCFGPLGGADGDLLLTRVGEMVATDLPFFSPLPQMIEDLSQNAWNVSNSTSAYSVPVGRQMSESFAIAAAVNRAGDAVRIDRDNPNVPDGYDPFMRGALLHWQRQYARYEEARDELLAYDRDVHTPTFADKDVSDDVADAVQERFDELLSIEHDETARLYRIPAPGPVELAIKLQIFERMNGSGLFYAAEAIRQITIDARRHGRLGAHLQTDAPLLDAFASRRREFVASEGVDLTGPAEEAYFARLDANDAVLLSVRATTVEGVLAKLRVGFANSDPEAWSDQAMTDPACPTFREGLANSGRYEPMMWSAIEDLARIAGVSLSEQGR